MSIGFPTNTVVFIIATMIASGASAWFTLSQGLERLPLAQQIRRRWRWSAAILLSAWLLLRLALARVPAEFGRVGMVAMVTLLAAGFYMMATVWGGVAWITVTLGAIVLMIVLGMAVTGRRMAVIGRMANTERGPLSPTLRPLLQDPVLWISIQTRVAIALGIVFLMTVKPDLSGSLLTIGVAAALGLASALPNPGRKQVQEEVAE